MLSKSYFASTKGDVVCQLILMLPTAMHWVMVLQLSFIMENLGWYHRLVLLFFIHLLDLAQEMLYPFNKPLLSLLCLLVFNPVFFLSIVKIIMVLVSKSTFMWLFFIVCRLGIWMLLLKNRLLVELHWLRWWTWRGDMVY